MAKEFIGRLQQSGAGKASSGSGRSNGRRAGVPAGAKNGHPLALMNARIVTPFRAAEDQCILLQDGAIRQIGSAGDIRMPPRTRVVDLSGSLVAPGFIDLHLHGASGFSFNTADERQLDCILEHSLAHGTTGVLATLYMDESRRFLGAVRRLREYARKGRFRGVLQGLHLEGPFINPDMAGAMNNEFVWTPTLQNWLRLKKCGGSQIRIMTIAPEVPGALEVMQKAAQDQVILAIAHSRAAYESIELAIDNGLTQVTHIFNAMEPMHHRMPGIVAAAMLKRELKVHLIADGVHVHKAIMELLYRLKGVGGIVLITDAISLTGQMDGAFTMAGRKVQVRQGTAYLGDGRLAGSTLTMERAVKTMMDTVGVPLAEAVRMASLNPARVLGLEHRKGILAVGKDADLVVLNPDFKVQMTVVGGRIVWERQD